MQYVVVVLFTILMAVGIVGLCHIIYKIFEDNEYNKQHPVKGEFMKEYWKVRKERIK